MAPDQSWSEQSSAWEPESQVVVGNGSATQAGNHDILAIMAMIAHRIRRTGRSAPVRPRMVRAAIPRTWMMGTAAAAGGVSLPLLQCDAASVTRPITELRAQLPPRRPRCWPESPAVEWVAGSQESRHRTPVRAHTTAARVLLRCWHSSGLGGPGTYTGTRRLLRGGCAAFAPRTARAALLGQSSVAVTGRGKPLCRTVCAAPSPAGAARPALRAQCCITLQRRSQPPVYAQGSEQACSSAAALQQLLPTPERRSVQYDDQQRDAATCLLASHGREARSGSPRALGRLPRGAEKSEDFRLLRAFPATEPALFGCRGIQDIVSLLSDVLCSEGARVLGLVSLALGGRKAAGEPGQTGRKRRTVGTHERALGEHFASDSRDGSVQWWGRAAHGEWQGFCGGLCRGHWLRCGHLDHFPARHRASPLPGEPQSCPCILLRRPWAPFSTPCLSPRDMPCAGVDEAEEPRRHPEGPPGDERHAGHGGHGAWQSEAESFSSRLVCPRSPVRPCSPQPRSGNVCRGLLVFPATPVPAWQAREEGFKGLYAGMGVRSAHALSQAFVYFFAYNLMRRKWEARRRGILRPPSPSSPHLSFRADPLPHHNRKLLAP